MLFWQEFLHNQRRDVRDVCMAAISDEAYIDKIEDENAKEVISIVRDELNRLFKLDGEYKKIARFVRCVILPHSEEGVFDTLEEVDAWIDSQDSSFGKRGKVTSCPLGLKVV